MPETITRLEYEKFLSLAPTNLLEQVGDRLSAIADELPEGSADLDILLTMLLMLGKEYQLRQIEPLWRKARRFTIRNSDTFKQIGKIAACIGAGFILGASMDD
ncbi:MAG: hypothetical protein A2173_06730 [Planctomycetes bacterium RBG_13_44_8b]|nr:MAG: hypothetical protein A2173_06730 [Planctomycetes bacterium RBG_13_44_8b]